MSRMGHSTSEMISRHGAALGNAASVGSKMSIGRGTRELEGVAAALALFCAVLPFRWN